MEKMHMTVADLEAAKNRIAEDAHYVEAIIGTPLDADMHIAATCIGIVEEMVKCSESTITGYKWIEGKEDGNIVALTEDGRIFVATGVPIMTRPHIVALHNLWLKVVAAFGGEVSK